MRLNFVFCGVSVVSLANLSQTHTHRATQTSDTHKNYRKMMVAPTQIVTRIVIQTHRGKQ